nr:immunoglobulin light chain junction region [Macaca mulatta]
SQHSYDTPYSF